ncbi:hypothetical protein GCM10022245_15530 [Streptomyces mayteni]
MLVAPAGLRERFGDLDEVTARDLATLISGGAGVIVNDWLVGAEDPLAPEELADRLLHLLTVLGGRGSATGGA